MKTANTPAKQSLFSVLANHEIAQTEVNAIGSSQSGLRPRLPSRYETLDANFNDLTIEEQSSEVSKTLSSSGLGVGSPSAIGSRDFKTSFPQDNVSQPGSAPQYQSQLSADSPVAERISIKSNDQDLDTRTQLTPVRISDQQDKLSTGVNGHMSPVPNVLQTPQAVKLPQEKSITERLAAVERETIREIHSLNPLLPQSDRQSRLIPQKQLVQAPELVTKEKGSQTNIEIHIGRIEVRANIQAIQPKLEKTPASPAGNDSLHAYLRNRSRGSRS
ncbi:MAG: hypothetical protein IPH22_08545 [Nitrosomonas sp.]|nr:hypothetical protein [Nitrosomonas sp.]